ncbi:MAG: acyl-CoA thioesterase domain-containing protein [Burkholderiales bacterium]
MTERLPPWDPTDLPGLLQLEPIGPLRYRNRFGDPNNNGRSYGGQLVAQALMAASQTVPDDRPVTAIQFLFLQGAFCDVPLEFDVTVLQDGKRFSSRHVRAAHPGGRAVLDAHVTYAVPLESPSHTVPSTAMEKPEDLPALTDLPRSYAEPLNAVGSYALNQVACLDFRIVRPEGFSSSGLGAPRGRFWLRCKMQSDDARVHEGAFAYASDWWMNFSAIGAHVPELLAANRSLYVASLNHAIWFHRPFRADQWLHFDTESAVAERGRGLAFARYFDSTGQLVATVSQEALMTYKT